MSFIIEIDELMPITIGSALEKIHSSAKKPLKELRLFDMLLSADARTALRHGVYLFFDDKAECIYVGMCSSSHFAHRIGGHFGMSPKYGMNTFLRRAVRELDPKGDSYESYVQTLPRIGKYSLLIIDANNKGSEFLRALERMLHRALKPRLNFPGGYPKTYRAIDTKANFGEVLVRSDKM